MSKKDFIQPQSEIREVFGAPVGCSFCNIEPNERNIILKETAYCTVLISNPMRHLNHVLVIPKRHVSRIDKLTGVELADLFTTVAFCNKKLLGRTTKTGCDICIHYRPFLKDDGIKVKHLHVHVIPLKQGDRLHRHRSQEVNLFRISSAKNNQRLTELFTDL